MSDSSGCCVYKDIVREGLCIGCGMCAAICPAGRLSIFQNHRGYLEVVQSESPCIKGCNLCQRVCPFTGINPDTSTLAADIFANDRSVLHNKVTGYYRSALVGYASNEEQRMTGASGGLATSFLCELLRRKIVDHVLSVGRNTGSDRLFGYTICKTPDEVIASAKSAYYPVEMSEVLKIVMGEKKKFAITCLPCFARTLRLAAKTNPIIRQNLVCIAGLVCGHSVSSYFAEYAATLAGSDNGTCEVIFRTKSSSQTAANHGTRVLWSTPKGEESRVVKWSDGLKEAWDCDWFTPGACFNCDDTFTELADVVFMDAWLLPYVDDFRGTSIVLTRSLLADEVIKSQCENGDLNLNNISVQDVIRSQVGALRNKTEYLSYRRWLMKQQESSTCVRVTPVRPSLLSKLLVTSRIRAAEIGWQAWCNRCDLNSYVAEMRHVRRLYCLVETAMRPVIFVRRVLHKFRRAFRKR